MGLIRVEPVQLKTVIPGHKETTKEKKYLVIRKTAVPGPSIRMRPGNRLDHVGSHFPNRSYFSNILN